MVDALQPTGGASRRVARTTSELDHIAHATALALDVPLACLIARGTDGELAPRGCSGMSPSGAWAVGLHDCLVGVEASLALHDPHGAADERDPGVALLRDLGGSALLAVPLPLASDEGLGGCLCVLDREPRQWTGAEERLLRALAGWSAHELRARRLLEERSDAEEGLRLLHSLSEGIARAQDINSAILLVLGHVCQRTGWDYGEAWLASADGGRLERCPSWFSLRGDLGGFARFSADLSFVPGEGLPGMVWESGRPAWVNDLAELPSYIRMEEAREAGLRAGVAIPVLANQSIVAVLAFHCRELGPEDERLTALIASATAQLGTIFRRKIAEEARRRSEATLAGILHLIPDAIVSIDAEQRIRIFNTGAEQVFGYLAEEVLGEPLDILLPERARASHRAHVERFIASQDTARWMAERGQISGRRRDGELFPAEATISRLGEGRSCTCTVVLRDVSERVRTERLLADTRTRLESILTTAGEGIVGLDVAGRVTFVNPVAARLLGYMVDELVGSVLHELVHHRKPDGTPYPADDCPVLAVLRTGEPFTSDAEVFWHRDGRAVPVEYTTTPLMSGGEVRGAVVTFADITERRAAESALRTLVMRDELTGLLNRRGFLSMAERQLAACRRSGATCLMLYLDVDDFKAINDTHGHLVGDRALMEVASLLRDTCRQSDLVGRLGGDEFVVLAMDGGQELEGAMLERLSRKLATANAWRGSGYTLSLSVGTALWQPGDRRTLSELMAEADSALYDRKWRRRARREDDGTATASAG